MGSVSDNTWLEEDSEKSRGHRQGNRVYGDNGVSPALSVNKGGASGNSQVIAEQDYPRMVINHQERPETRPSIAEEGQSGGSGLLYNNEYSYALSNSPHFVTDVQPVYTPDFIEKGANKKNRVGSRTGDMFTIDGTSQHGITDGVRIRKLTPRECWRLQGFPDSAFEKAEKVNSDTQLYKQAGNAVTVNVVEAIGNRMKEVL